MTLLGGIELKGFKNVRIKNVITYILSILCTMLATLCFIIRVPYIIKTISNPFQLFSASFILPNGIFSKLSNRKNDFLNDKTSQIEHNKVHSKKPFKGNVRAKNNDNKQVISYEEEEHSQDEKTYKITETQFAGVGMSYENFYVKNKTNINLNIAEELSKRPDINIKKDGNPQVLIIHTHTTESYMKMDQGFYYESFYPRSIDPLKNVIQVGNAIEEKLKKAKIGVIHDTTYHDNPTYNGSYSRSAATIRSNLEKYPSINVVLDIHRDAIGSNNCGKIKPTFKVDGRKAAQIMIISGCDQDGTIGFKDWEYNLRFALRLQKMGETMYPGLTRALSFANVKYNMNITHGSLLIEVGSDSNTLDEAVYSGGLLGNALVNVLNELMK